MAMITRPTMPNPPSASFGRTDIALTDSWGPQIDEISLAKYDATLIDNAAERSDFGWPNGSGGTASERFEGGNHALI